MDSGSSIMDQFKKRTFSTKFLILTRNKKNETKILQTIHFRLENMLNHAFSGKYNSARFFIDTVEPGYGKYSVVWHFENIGAYLDYCKYVEMLFIMLISAKLHEKHLFHDFQVFPLVGLQKSPILVKFQYFFHDLVTFLWFCYLFYSFYLRK